MKKLITLILTICIIALSACGSKDASTAPAADDTVASSKEEASEEKKEETESDAVRAADDADLSEDDVDEDDNDNEEEIEAKNGVLSNGVFSIALPKAAEGKYVATMTDNSIAIYEAENHKNGFGGFVYSIDMWADPDDYAGSPYTKFGELKDPDGKIYDATIIFATDAQWDVSKSSEMPEDYKILFDSAEDAEKSVASVIGGTFEYGGGTKGEDLYSDVIAQFKKAISEGWDATKLEENDMSTVYYVVTQGDEKANAMDVTGYAFKDINSDGVDEMLVGEITEGQSKGTIYDIYTMIDRKPAHVISGWDRNRYYALEGGVIANEWSESAASSGVCSYYLQPNSTELVGQIGVKEDYSENESKPWYVTYDVDKDEWQSCTEAEYNEYLGRINDYVRLDFTPFSKAK